MLNFFPWPFSNGLEFWKSFKGSWSGKGWLKVCMMRLGGSKPIRSIWNHLDFHYDFCVYLIILSYLYIKPWTGVCRNYQKSSTEHCFLAWKKINTGHRIILGKKSVICSQLNQACGPIFSHYSGWRLVRALKERVNQRNNLLLKTVLNTQFKEIKIWSSNEKKMDTFWRSHNLTLYILGFYLSKPFISPTF